MTRAMHGARVIFCIYVVVSLVGTLGYIALALAGR
jgi:hypothetical protein